MTTLTKAATIDCQVVQGPDLAPDTSKAKREALLLRLVPGEVEVMRD